jgi:Cu(I)/Ag(I) efflux system membrane fusion protein
MSAASKLCALLGGVLIVAAAGGGYWLGQQRAASPTATAEPARTAGEPAKRKILFYRNPMGLPDTSPTPKKDPMGMDYLAVYEGDDEREPVPANQLAISAEKVQKLGVRSEAAQLRRLDRTVRAAGRIEPDERKTYAITPKFEGYIERLHVNVTGQAVAKGQPLFEVYSPELVSAQREYALAAHGADTLKAAGGSAQTGMQQLAEASLARLRNWDVSPAQIDALAHSGEAKRTLTFRSPVAGIVTEKKALQGMRFMPGEALYQIADLSSVWVVADVFEQDIGLVRPGVQATVRINAYQDKALAGKVSYVYPTLNAATRTVPVRIDLPNPGLLLKPAMFAQVELAVAAERAVVTVPVSAVIDSGKRQIVLIERGEGRFEAREVRLGARSDRHIEVIDGVGDGERVVVAANFLIDAESNLQAAIGGMSAAGKGGKDEPAAAKTTSHHAEGTVEEVDPRAATISLSHGPVATLKWPAMTMEFALANASLLPMLKPGARVAVDFVERQRGEWVITRVTPLAAAPAAASDQPNKPHAGH